MADIEELAGMLPTDLDWVSDAFTFLEYAEDEHQGHLGMPSAHGHPGPSNEHSRTRHLPACHAEQGKHKRGRVSETCHPVPDPSPRPSVTGGAGGGCHTAGIDCEVQGGIQLTNSKDMGPRPDAIAQRMERKKTREKMRRMEVNDGFNELLEVLTEVEPMHEQSSAARSGAGDKGNFRVELLGRAVRALRRLNQEAKAEHAEVERLRLQLQASGISTDEHKPIVPGLPSVLAPRPDGPPAPGAGAGGCESPHGLPGQGGPSMQTNAAPMWVTVPMWPRPPMPMGHKPDLDPSKPAPYPLMMPFCMPPNVSPLALHPPGFMGMGYPMPSPTGGSHSMQFTPPPTDQDGDLPTHAPCA